MMMQRRSLLAGLGASLAFPALARGAEEGALISGGPIYTGIAKQPMVEALLVRGNRIVFAGALADATSQARGLKRIDLKGAAAFPGFTDCHVHFTGLGLQLMTVDGAGTRSIAELQARIGDYAKRYPGLPVVGSGWIETQFAEQRFPTRAEMDAVVSDRPLFINRTDGHAAIVNSAALTLAGITRDTPDPPGGRIERDAQGDATGMLIDNAMALVESKLPRPTIAQKREAVRLATALYASRGWVGGHNMSVDSESLHILAAMAQDGTLPVRAANYMDPDYAEEVLKRGPYAAVADQVKVNGAKFYTDGALGSRGALLSAPYSDMPATRGLKLFTDEAASDIIRRCFAARCQVAAHAIGDAGNHLALDRYEAALGKRDAGRRWRIEHAQIVAAADMPRFKAMGVIASMQPSHAISDMLFAPARLGPDRLGGAYAWKSLWDHGAVVCGGSDAPVERGEPQIEFYAAMHRHALDGFAGPDWHLEQRLSRDQALALFTRNAAYAAFETRRGALAVGNAADVSVFDTDFMTAEPARIARAKALLTMVNGTIRHNKL